MQFPWAEIASQLGVGAVIAWLLVKGAENFLKDQRERDAQRYKDMSAREERWFDLVRSTSQHMATNNELLRTQNHLLRNLLTEMNLSEVREKYDAARQRRRSNTDE